MEGGREAGCLTGGRHTSRDGAEPFYGPRRCLPRAPTAPDDRTRSPSRWPGFSRGSLEDARQRTPCYLACRHATAACVTSTGEGGEKSFRLARRRSSSTSASASRSCADLHADSHVCEVFCAPTTINRGDTSHSGKTDDWTVQNRFRQEHFSYVKH